MSTDYPDKDEYRSSRICYIIEAMIENFITVLTTGAFLATLTKVLGISDSLTAILSSVVSLSGLFQIITIFIAHKTPVKRWIIPLQLLAHLMLSGLYLIPVFNVTQGAGLLFFVLIIGANAIKQIISPAKINWFYTLVAPDKRGSYSSILTAISVIGQIFFSLGASFILDSFVAAGNQQGAFTLLTVVIFVLIVLDIIPLFISKEKPEDTERAPSPFGSLRTIFANKGYRTFLIITTIQAVGTGITTPFLNTYQINELGFSLSFIAIIDTVVNVVWIAALLLFGRMSNKFSYAYIKRAASFLYVLSFGTLIFTNSSNGAVLFVVYRIFMIIAQSAAGVTTRGLIFDLSTAQTRTGALATQTMFTGVISFATTLITTPIFNFLQKNPVSLFGVQMHAQQVLSIATLIIVVVVNILWFICFKRMDVRH